MSITVVFLGNDEWSVPSLGALAAADDLHVELVVTNPARPAGRGSKLTPTAVFRAASSLNLPVFETPGIGTHEGVERLRAASPDVMVVVAYGELLSAQVLWVAKLGPVNLHFSLLPRWRGASPVQRAIMAGDPSTGVTAMLMDEGLDTGPMILSEEVAIEPGEDAGTLGGRLASIGARVLVSAVRSLAAGTASPRPQDPALATSAPKLSKSERTIDWNGPASTVVRQVRALCPEPGAETSRAGRTLKIFSAETVDPAPVLRHEPGTVVEVLRDSLVVAAAGSGVRLIEVAEASRKRMSAGAWARGSRLSAGERLG